MTDMDRVDKLPGEYRAAAKNTLAGVDRVRLAGKNVAETGGDDAETEEAEDGQE